MQHAYINSVRASTRSAEDCRLDAAAATARGLSRSNGNDPMDCPVAPEEGHQAPSLIFLSKFHAPRSGRYRTPFYAHFYDYSHPALQKEPPTRYTYVLYVCTGKSKRRMYLNIEIDPLCLASFKDVLALN